MQVALAPCDVVVSCVDVLVVGAVGGLVEEVDVAGTLGGGGTSTVHAVVAKASTASDRPSRIIDATLTQGNPEPVVETNRQVEISRQ